MSVIFVLLGLLIVAGAALLLVGKLDASPSGDESGGPTVPPTSGWSADAVERLKFRVVLRGYRMDEVDAVLASLAEELRSRSLREESDPDAASAYPATD